VRKYVKNAWRSTNVIMYNVNSVLQYNNVVRLVICEGWHFTHTLKALE
jgi:hypothetical protein